MQHEPCLSWPVGSVRITRVVELGMATPQQIVLPDSTAEMIDRNAWLRPEYADGQGSLFYNVQAFVIEARGQRIVVDTCVGNDKARKPEFLSNLQTPFLDNLKRAGFEPEAIDVVLCTHLHLDHVGWNTHLKDGKWVPTFPNARYLFGRVDWEQVAAPGRVDPSGDIFGDSLLPIMQAGLCDLVEVDHVINEDVRLQSTPGHTAGHVSVHIHSADQEAVITGDMIHHPLQCAEPELVSSFCEDRDLSIATRKRFLADCSDRGTLVIGTHFAGSTAGYVIAGQSNYRFAGWK